MLDDIGCMVDDLVRSPYEGITFFLSNKYSKMLDIILDIEA